MDDMISRQKVLEAMQELKDDKRINPLYQHFEVQGMLEELAHKIREL